MPQVAQLSQGKARRGPGPRARQTRAPDLQGLPTAVTSRLRDCVSSLKWVLTRHVSPVPETLLVCCLLPSAPALTSFTLWVSASTVRGVQVSGSQNLRRRKGSGVMIP